MQIIKLDELWRPVKTIDVFESFVWVERFQTAGDFVIEVKNDPTILTTLPLGVGISHTDTKQVMLVENHEIVRNEKKELTIKVTGRSFETFTENRPAMGSDQPLNDPITGDPIAETTLSVPAEYVVVSLLAKAIVLGTATNEDAVDNVQVVSDVRELDDPLEHVIKRGDTYSRVLEFLKLGNVGIKTERPIGSFTTLNVFVHDGADRRATVVFYAQQDDLENTTYFWSIKGYRNYAQIAANTYSRLYLSRNVDTLTDDERVGLKRRTMYVEADDIEGIYDPPTPTDVISGRGQVELDAHKKIALLTARVSTTAKPKFKIHYDIGDLVTAFGEFSTSQLMRVTEHILTVDKAGLRGYPSLTAI